MVLVKDILNWVNEIAPFRYSADWDNCGLLVGDPESEVVRLLVALDISSDTLYEAEQYACQCILSHHPAIFSPMHSVTTVGYPESLVFRAIKSGVNLIAAHTNLDSASRGINSRIAELLEMEDIEPLEADERWQHEPAYGGMGRIGVLSSPGPLDEFASRVRDALGSNALRVVGDPGKRVKRVALCSGSGGSLMDLALRARVDAFITGDLKYHEAHRALENGMALIDIGHFGSERLIVHPLAQMIGECAERAGADLWIREAVTESDPFRDCVVV